MADLRCEIAGVKAPNPFWLASAPPTDKKYNVERAFKAGWGGAVWKTLGEDPPIVNVTSRYGAVAYNGQRIAGFNNIELITDRPLDVNLREIKELKHDWPDRPIIVSLMVPCEEANWQAILNQVEDCEADGVELNFGCPHGMNERGMGAAVGQVPDYVEMVTRWCRAHTRMPIFVKLTPNVADIVAPARAAKAGGAQAVSLINTINSIVSIDLDSMAPTPTIDGKGTQGGYCGPAVKPISLHKVSEIARDPECAGLEISGIGGIEDWRDAVEYMALGSGPVQVCTAVMHYGFKIIDDMVDGLGQWMDGKGYRTLDNFRGLALANLVDWQDLNMNYELVARIDQDLCISCGLCHIVCEDTAHQAITAHANGERKFQVIDAECVGCNLCQHVCPVQGCISMVAVANGLPYVTWPSDPRNPDVQAAE